MVIRASGTLGELDKGAEVTQHISRTGVSFCLLGDSDEALPVPYKVTCRVVLGYRFLTKPTPLQWVKVSTSFCWLDPHTLSSCEQEGVCQGTPELASSPLAPVAFHRWKSVRLKVTRRTHNGLEKHSKTLSGMQHRPARQVRWRVTNGRGRHFPRRTYGPACA